MERRQINVAVALQTRRHKYLAQTYQQGHKENIKFFRTLMIRRAFHVSSKYINGREE